MRKMSNLKNNRIIRTIVIILITLFVLSSNVQATNVVSEVSGGGEIQSSKLGQGLLNIVRDVTGTMQWILPIVRSMFYLILCI